MPARPLVDRFGRVHTDLRVSLTDRCDLRCRYCMPAEGLPWLPRAELLTDAEVLRVVGVAVRDLGVRSVRLTGGEPALRRGLVDLVRGLATLRPRPALAMTTNGTALARLAGPLAEAGLDRVNVSLDTLRPERFLRLTRRDRLPDVLSGLRAASAAGLTPVKVNVVVWRGFNDDEIVPLAEFCVEHGYQVRFLEQMPLDAQREWSADGVVTGAEVLDRLATRWSLTPVPGRGAAPAETFLLDGVRSPDGAPAVVGVVAPVSRPFCRSCDRLRLTADGQIRACLFATRETDLRTPLRDGASDAELAERWRTAVAGKEAGHRVAQPDFEQPARPMSAIGG
ncbi:cyclic pyranopterin phosphate synthase [Streptoalloteichus tenebrarius]|uniref:GTP 3',8-cyclase n=1 Tax=Streptoalloteichus tenebrarius (strain ATCC 17920 / DSM 40477 / JCM 4838 / CBS 697.72 / NBRC 16177 / NCIMB 11028 / NRRL B-12390 / A12253. 1 / ISP 5477) TaxID=1933 RepID=A0ABT1I1U9_STRSD|nr:GTP 3',8-cyclase MoaA [Streptoalloteichus tenebrarius]MCP2261763.1 cyclic pyranopterin phosphate synthase [Streptoalloteichus tenebrarius]BFF00819.1 GTP 3',8-cyclase MoaA [Streptoalloteichus tenebrarius]